ncbi:MAG TPA: pyridoxal 5'-phosphate synthase glutaminase subunit PdxT [Lachnospiraceae bacterium]|nr:pyridoxal 5'-phosphate synthase glutaminase subunit PdxT [Lachnospiraceae bacterium]
MRVAVLALQGAFMEHEQMLWKIGTDTVELRKKEDLDRPFHALILPGGESTVQGKLLRELGMFDGLQERIREGLPVLATCAGLILLAEEISNDKNVYFGTLPVTVKRNAYGRQLSSFHTEEMFEGLGIQPMEFIRAPYIEHAGKDVEILSGSGDRITAVRYKNQLAMSFHPELCENTDIHEAFIKNI